MSRGVFRRLASVRVAVLCVFAASCGGAADAERALREGRFDDAHRAFTAELAAEDEPSPRVLLAAAIAALRAGDPSAAEAAAARCAAAGDAEYVALSDFVLGNVAFARCLLAARQALGPEAEPFAFDIALAHGDTALRAWERAAASRDDWPEARRNVERVLRLLDDLRAKRPGRPPSRKAGQPDPRPKPAKKPEKEPDAPPAPTMPEPPPRGEGPKKPDADPSARDLSPGEVLRLLERLVEKDREKVTMRRARQESQSSGVEQDW